MSEIPKYHSEIEENFETSGQDIGRIKNTEFVHKFAVTENIVRDNEREMIKEGWPIEPRTEEEWNEKGNTFAKYNLAKRAVVSASDTLLQNIMVSGVNGEQLMTDPQEEVMRLQQKAKTVGEDYDTLQRQASLAAEARKNDAEFLDLSSDEFTKALAEAPVYRKSTIVSARSAEVGEVVVTVTPDGVEEGKNTAGEGDYVVTGANGADFILPAEKFNKLYEATDDDGRFQAKGMARIIDNPTGKIVGILAPWGEMQYGDPESKIAVQYDPESPDTIGSDRYVLDSNEFAVYRPL